jgi:hypothetical protein
VVHLDKVPLEGEVPLDVVHPNKVPLEEVVHSDEVPPLEEVVQLKEVVRPNKVPLEDEVPLDVVQDKPVLSMPAEDMPAKGELVEDKLGKLHQMEADSPAVNVIAYMCIITKLGNVKGLRIGMDPLRGVFWSLEGPV